VIYSLTIKYAIEACVHLAQIPAGENAHVREISREATIPIHFLAKILQQLARKGILVSTKGPTGGFSLRYPPEKISLMHVINAMDALSEYGKSVCGLTECTDDQVWAAHDGWKEVQARITDYLHRTTIADLETALAARKREAGLEQVQPAEIVARAAGD